MISCMVAQDSSLSLSLSLSRTRCVYVSVCVFHSIDSAGIEGNIFYSSTQATFKNLVRQARGTLIIEFHVRTCTTWGKVRLLYQGTLQKPQRPGLCHAA